MSSNEEAVTAGSRVGGVAVIIAFPWYNFGMPSKKHSKSRLIVKRRGKDFSKPAGFRSTDKQFAKPLPDTSRIPWFPPRPKTGTDA